MTDAVKALLSLQEIDRELYQVNSELRRLPKERDKRQSHLDSREAVISEARGRINNLRTLTKEIDDETTIMRQRLRKLQGEANNTRSDMALLAAYQHEMRELKRSIGQAEDRGLEFVGESEQIAEQVSSVEEELSTLSEEFAEYSANIEREIAEATTRQEGLEARRADRVSGDLKPSDLELYRRLLQAREGVAMAELEGRVCQGCFMEVPPNLCVRLARGGSLTQCPSCDRILYPVRS